MLCLTPNGNPGLVTHDGTNITELIAHNPIPLNQWTYLMATQSHATAANYVNGIVDTVSTAMFTPAIYINHLFNGANSVSANWNSFEGIIDDVKIYDCSGLETGIDVPKSNSSIGLYPNPTAGPIHLSDFFNGKISVLNSLGKKVCENTATDLSTYPSSHHD